MMMIMDEKTFSAYYNTVNIIYSFERHDEFLKKNVMDLDGSMVEAGEIIDSWNEFKGYTLDKKSEYYERTQLIPLFSYIEDLESAPDIVIVECDVWVEKSLMKVK